ncbi:MAG: PKD domain-containing protein [Crocinitomicaceae bacterium]
MNNFDKIIKDAVEGFEAPFDPTAWDKLSNQLSPMEDAFRNAVKGHEAPYNPSIWSNIKGQISGSNSIINWIAGSAAVVGLVAGVVYFWTGDNQSTIETPLANNVIDIEADTESNSMSTDQYAENHGTNDLTAFVNEPAEDQVISNENNNDQNVAENNDHINDNVHSHVAQDNSADNNSNTSNNSNTADQNESNSNENHTTDIVSGLDNADRDQNIVVDAPEINAVIMLSGYALCQGDALVCSAKRQEGNVTYTWKFGDGTYGSGRSADHEYKTNGKFEVILTIRDAVSNKILATSHETVVVNEIPKLDFSWDQQNVVIPMLDFINLSDQASNWEWHVNGQIVSDQNQMAYTFREKGNYVVSLSAENEFGCENQIQKSVSIKDDYNLLAPTAFSPNGDNLNETFIPSALLLIDAPEFNMTIYNESADLVYQTSDMNMPWNGSNQIDNTQVPDGAYIWVVNHKNKNGIMETYKGQVLVVR